MEVGPGHDKEAVGRGSFSEWTAHCQVLRPPCRDNPRKRFVHLRLADV